MGFKIIGELSDRLGATALGGEQYATLIDIDEQGHVIVAALCGGFVDGDAAHLAVVGALTRLLDPVVEDAPHAGVVLTHEACGSGDRHGRHQRPSERLEQQREAGARPRPRHGDLLDAAVGAGDARRTSMQERLVLEEVEVPPRLHGGVVHGTVGLGAVRAREAAALREIDLDIETTGLGIEIGRLDHPRRHKAESELQ